MAWVTVAKAMAGIEWHLTDKSFTCDEVTQDIDGNTFVDGVAILYKVYVRNAVTGVESFVYETTDIVFNVSTYNLSGFNYPGVSAMAMFEGDVINGTEGAITWSDSTDSVAVPVPFGLVVWQKLQSPKGLRLVK